MCCVYDGLEKYNHYEPQQDTNNPNPTVLKLRKYNKRSDTSVSLTITLLTGPGFDSRHTRTFVVAKMSRTAETPTRKLYWQIYNQGSDVDRWPLSSTKVTNVCGTLLPLPRYVCVVWRLSKYHGLLHLRHYGTPVLILLLYTK
jgi:hypothetical protein